MTQLAATYDALAEWICDDQPFEDCELQSADPGSGRLAFGSPRASQPSYWSQRAAWLRHWRAPTESIQTLTLTARGKVRCVVDATIALPAPVLEVDPAGTGKRVGFRIRLGRGKSAELIGDRYEITRGSQRRAKTFRTDARHVDVLGEARLTAKQVKQAIAATGGGAVEVWNNWLRSGQSFGSAFVEERRPTRARPGDELDGAWLVTKAGAEPSGATGVWIAGGCADACFNAEITRSTRIPDVFFRAVLRGLASVRGVRHATSGNVLFEGDEITAWLAEGTLPSAAAKAKPRQA